MRITYDGLKKNDTTALKFQIYFSRRDGMGYTYYPVMKQNVLKFSSCFKFTRRDENCIIKKACENLITL